MFRRRRKILEIAPDEIFLDASNLPGLDTRRLEGRMERPVGRRAIIGVGIVFACIVLAYSGKAFSLEIMHGASYADISRNNTLRRSIDFATRGVIYDRTGKMLAWNVAQVSTSSINTLHASSTATSTVDGSSYALRKYSSLPGLSILLGFVSYPQADKSGAWWREDYKGVAGIESEFDSELDGVNGYTMVEKNALGKIERQDLVAPPKSGQNLTLSIDADVTSHLYQALVDGAKVSGFQGGAGLIMNVHTGELLAITSFPEYDHQAFEDGDSAAISAASNDPLAPMLDRAVAGLYAPGSIVKPMFAAGALDAGIISASTTILSTGALIVPNPYDPSNPSIFHDWTVHGPIDMETAIAVSSDEYFYTIGGGFGDQKGLGIAGLDKYAEMFGLNTKTNVQLPGEQTGIIPSPEWKRKVFGPDKPWLLGDTYHTAIGQFGFQITPIEAVRYAGALATGKLFVPQILASSTPSFTEVPIPEKDLSVARAGMRLAVTSTRRDATLNVFNIPGIEMAAKSGTAQLGDHNQWVNSWAIGFWPASDPKYVFAVVLEKAPSTETYNAADSVAPFFRWLIKNHPEYVQ